MRPNVGDYCALEHGTHATTGSTIRSLAAYPAAALKAQYPAAGASWPQHACYNAPPPLAPVAALPQRLTVAAQQTPVSHGQHQQQHQHQHQQQHQLQRQHQHQHQHQHQTARQLQAVPASSASQGIYQHGGGGFQQHPHHLAPLQDVQAGAPHNYAKLPPNSVNQQRINECAGIPLISNASSHLTPAQRQRVLRKASHSPSQAQRTASAGELHTAGASTYNWHLQANAAAAGAGGGARAFPQSGIAQLAAHAQGAPLLLNQQQQQYRQPPPPQPQLQSQWAAVQSNATAFHATNRSFATPAQHYAKVEKSRAPLRYQNSAPAALSTRSKELTNGATELNSNTISGDGPQKADGAENSNAKDLVETCLPRIIKPRKRRKKDRKPANGVFLKMDASVAGAVASAAIATEMEQQAGPVAHFVTKPQTSHRFPNDSGNATLPYYAMNPPNRRLTHEQLRSLQRKETPQQCFGVQVAGVAGVAGATHCAAASSSHGVCFCQACDPLRSIWDYPLRRSLSDSSAASASDNSTESSSSTSAFSSDATSGSCSPTHMRQSAVDSALMTNTDESFAPITTTSCLANIVGVIGSNRAVSNSNNNNNHSGTNAAPSSAVPNGSVSDSNDSGYGDILSGINLADDLFNHTTITNNNDPTVGPNVLLPPSPPAAATIMATPFALLPETAETLLTESINEISRKLIETCANELPSPTLSPSPSPSTPQPSSGSGCSSRTLRSFSVCSDFSNDSGIDSLGVQSGFGAFPSLVCEELVFNMDHLNLSALDGSCPISGLSSASSASSASSSSSSIKSNCSTSHEAAAPLPPPPAKRTELAKYLATPTMETLLDLNNNRYCGNEKDESYSFATKHQQEHHHHQHQQQHHHQQQQQQQQQQYNKRQQLKEQYAQPQQQQQQHNQQFFSNCFDLMWPNSSFDDSSNTASIYSSLGKMKTAFSTIS